MAASKSDEQYILTLLDKASRHEASEAELRYLDLWYDSFQEAPLYTDGMSPEEEEQAMSMLFDRIHNQIEQRIQEDISIKSIPIYKRILPFLKYAAAILLFLALPLYFFRDSLPPAVTELKLVQEVSDVLKKQNPLTISEEFVEEIQLELSQDRKINLLAKDFSALANAEKYIRITRGDSQITYTLQDSTGQFMSSAVVYHTIKVPYGKRFSIELVDGTSVSLNSGTELRYPINSRSHQDMDLYLKGEAYFDVTKSQGRRFNVHVAGNGSTKEHVIQVLGTQFNIRSFPKDKESVTTLFEGAIQVSGIGETPIQLYPSQQIAVGQSFAISEADLNGALAWRSGVFYFKHTPLDEVCDELERWYGVRVRYKKGKETKRLLAQISRKKTLQEVIDMLVQTNDIKYQNKGKEVILID